MLFFFFFTFVVFFVRSFTLSKIRQALGCGVNILPSMTNGNELKDRSGLNAGWQCKPQKKLYDTYFINSYKILTCSLFRYSLSLFLFSSEMGTDGQWWVINLYCSHGFEFYSVINLMKSFGGSFPLNACQHTEHIPLYCHSMRGPLQWKWTFKWIILYILYLVHHLNKILLPFFNDFVWMFFYTSRNTALECTVHHLISEAGGCCRVAHTHLFSFLYRRNCNETYGLRDINIWT